MSRLRARLTYANVMATAAVFIALGGSSYAALKLPKKSVGGAQLKANAVTSPKVKNGSLLSADFRAGQLTAGPQGASGPAGPGGPTGPPGSDAQFNGAAAGGDLAGTYPNPTVGPNAVGAGEIATNAVGRAEVADAFNFFSGLRKADIGAVSTTVSVDPPAISPQECAVVDVTVAGALANDAVIAHPLTDIGFGSAPGITFDRHLIAMPFAGNEDDEVRFRFCNVDDVNTENGTANNWRVLLIR